ncbi:MAG: zinc ribbon domain-containing protein, partial [Ruminococcaceae bacterium]|nr:zinc ribbon domain-containing protein [Oscillospiraceae bacterium]
MANCTKCGAVLADNEKFCDACGAPVATVEDKVNAAAEKASAKFEEIANTPDTTAQYTA